MNGLSAEETERYRANLALCEIDLPGQQKLKAAKVLVCGCGALSSPVLLYLAAAGIGTLGLCDGDKVNLSNLQRQVIHSTCNLGQQKTVSAAESVEAINPAVKVKTFPMMLTAENIFDIAKDFDLLIDCTDNYPSRRLISRAADEMGKPLCFAAVSRFEAQVFTQIPGAKTYQDIFPAPPTADQVSCTSCANAGVLNAAAGLAGSIQAAEAIKLITGVGEPLVNRFLLIDLLTCKFTTIQL
ncbi:MAG: HesA/MoeB/ThiF family protein [Muribaculaceae bacterium]|nr:HesA/MoeB/ThiF family protein [Muribaculaceae bacterium]